jgi:hypothetical protein
MESRRLTASNASAESLDYFPTPCQEENLTQRKGPQTTEVNNCEYLFCTKGLC